jgi:integrase
MKGCRPLTEGELNGVAESFGGHYGTRDRALFVLGVKTGFRVSELLSLRLIDVFRDGRVLDRVTVARRNMKRQTEGRTVVLHPAARAALAEWIGELGGAGLAEPVAPLFRGRKGGTAITRRQALRVLRGAYEANELTGPLGTHTMRKTFANRVHEALGRDIVKTQRALGHRNINSTVSYLSFREEEIDAAILAA